MDITNILEALYMQTNLLAMKRWRRTAYDVDTLLIFFNIKASESGYFAYFKPNIAFRIICVRGKGENSLDCFIKIRGKGSKIYCKRQLMWDTASFVFVAG